MPASPHIIPVNTVILAIFLAPWKSPLPMMFPQRIPQAYPRHNGTKLMQAFIVLKTKKAASIFTDTQLAINIIASPANLGQIPKDKQ
jgi:hypothetical protein